MTPDDDYWDFLCLLRSEGGMMAPIQVKDRFDWTNVYTFDVSARLIEWNWIVTRRVKSGNVFRTMWLLTEEGSDVVSGLVEEWEDREAQRLAEEEGQRTKRIQLQEQRALREREDFERYQTRKREALEKIAQAEAAVASVKAGFSWRWIPTGALAYPEDPLPPLAVKPQARRGWAELIERDEPHPVLRNEDMAYEDMFPGELGADMLATTQDRGASCGQ